MIHQPVKDTLGGRGQQITRKVGESDREVKKIIPAGENHNKAVCMGPTPEYTYVSSYLIAEAMLGIRALSNRACHYHNKLYCFGVGVKQKTLKP